MSSYCFFSVMKQKLKLHNKKASNLDFIVMLHYVLETIFAYRILQKNVLASQINQQNMVFNKEGCCEKFTQQ